MGKIATIDSSSPSPKTAVIGGVTFYRSRKGNLYRSGLVKGARKYVSALVNIVSFSRIDAAVHLPDL